jgi:hypothetical protein
MRLARLALAGVLAAAIAGCSLSISEINQRPAKYYQESVSFSGRVARLQSMSDETLLELEDTRGGRIFVRMAGPVEVETGDWVKVRGIFVPETKVGGRVLYDVVQGERISRRRAPRFQNLT